MGYGLLLKLGIVGIVLGLAFFLGWRQNGLRLNKQIDKLTREIATADLVVRHYEESQRQLQLTINQQVSEINEMRLKGERAETSISDLNQRLVDLDNEWQTRYNRLVMAPLPEDCELAVREAVKRLQDLIK